VIIRFIVADAVLVWTWWRIARARPGVPAAKRSGVLAQRTLACLAAVSIAAPSVVAQGLNRDSVMRVLRIRHDRIERGSTRYITYESSLDSVGLERWSTGRGRLSAAFESDTLRTVTASYTGVHGHATESYYFWNGAPFEVRVRLRDENDGSAGSHGAAEQRFYFNRGYLVRWVDPHRTIRPVTTGAVFARAMQLMADASRLVDAAHRTRDRALIPPTPVEMAESMRRELRGLMTAELAYYSENSRYTTDVVTVGYQPAPQVQLSLVDATDHGWSARATAVTLPGKSCVVYLGQLRKPPKTAADHARPPAEREVVCDKP
jgi:hypothetical protein